MYIAWYMSFKWLYHDANHLGNGIINFNGLFLMLSLLCVLGSVCILLSRIVGVPRFLRSLHKLKRTIGTDCCVVIILVMILTEHAQVLSWSGVWLVKGSLQAYVQSTQIVQFWWLINADRDSLIQERNLQSYTGCSFQIFVYKLGISISIYLCAKLRHFCGCNFLECKIIKTWAYKDNKANMNLNMKQIWIWL